MHNAKSCNTGNNQDEMTNASAATNHGALPGSLANAMKTIRITLDAHVFIQRETHSLQDPEERFTPSVQDKEKMREKVPPAKETAGKNDMH
jgi:hypothetical protein